MTVLVVDKSTDHDKPYFNFYVFVFYDNINAEENVFFKSTSWESATHWREQRGWDLVIFDWFVLSMRMQVILDSSFAHPGSAPIWGGKKGEFRDWTSTLVVHIGDRVKNFECQT